MDISNWIQAGASVSQSTIIAEKHTAATPVGMQVEVTARLNRINGNKLYFELVANDNAEQIGSGTHQRVIVDAKKFIRRVAAKARKQC